MDLFLDSQLEAPKNLSLYQIDYLKKIIWQFLKVLKIKIKMQT